MLVTWGRRALLDGEARRLRLAARMSYADVGRAIGARAQSVWAWENEGRRPTGVRAVRYAQLLDALRQQVDL